jgi:hypothetical protein
MFTVKGEPLVWDCLTETAVPVNHSVYYNLKKYINLTDWETKYDKLYHQWLYNDDETIYNINVDINKFMIDAIFELNKEKKDYVLYYWFDVDRDKSPDYTWVYCPFSGKQLITLNEQFHYNNRKISPEHPLVFPEQLF